MSNQDRPTSYAELADVLDALPLLVREKRRRCGLSLRAAAKDIGITFTTIHRIERGEDVVFSNARRVLRWLGQEHPSTDPDG